MTQTDVHEKIVAPLVGEMNLVDMKVYTDNGGEIREVLLKYSVPSGGPEPLSGGIFQGRIRIDEDATA